MSLLHAPAAALALLALVAPAAAAAPAPALLGEPVIEATSGKTFKVAFNLGFKLDCPHDITIDIEDDSVVCAVNPPASSKKTAFTFEAKTPGTSMITVSWSAAQPNCSGFAQQSVTVEVTPDLKVVIKEWKKEVNSVRKLFKSKSKDAFKEHCELADDILFDWEEGFISTVEALDQLGELLDDTAVGVSLDFTVCLNQLSQVARAILLANAFGYLPLEFQPGGCGSFWDDAVDSAWDEYDKLIAKLEKKFDKDSKSILKHDDGPLAGLAYWIAPQPLVVPRGPGLSTDPLEDLLRPLRAFTGVFVRADGFRRINLRGVAPAEWATVEWAVSGPDAFATTGSALVVPTTIESFGRWDVGFSGPESDGTLASGTYRIEVTGPDDTTPAEVLYAFVP